MVAVENEGKPLADGGLNWGPASKGKKASLGENECSALLYAYTTAGRAGRFVPEAPQTKLVWQPFIESTPECLAPSQQLKAGIM